MTTPPTEMHETPTQPKPTRRKADWREVRDRATVASVGLEVGLSILAGWYLGYLFDGAFESAPYGQIFFLLGGLGAAGKAIWRTVQLTKKVMSRPEPGPAALAEYDRRRTVTAATGAK